MSLYLSYLMLHMNFVYISLIGYGHTFGTLLLVRTDSDCQNASEQMLVKLPGTQLPVLEYRKVLHLSTGRDARMIKSIVFYEALQMTIQPFSECVQSGLSVALCEKNIELSPSSDLLTLSYFGREGPV